MEPSNADNTGNQQPTQQNEESNAPQQNEEGNSSQQPTEQSDEEDSQPESEDIMMTDGYDNENEDDEDTVQQAILWLQLEGASVSVVHEGITVAEVC